MGMVGLHACVSVYTCMADANGDQKRTADPLELELQIVRSGHVSARN